MIGKVAWCATCDVREGCRAATRCGVHRLIDGAAAGLRIRVSFNKGECMAKRKARSKPIVRRRVSAARSTGYKIERGIAKPAVMSGAKTPERLTLEAMKVGQSFAFTDKAIVKRVKDICYRLKQERGRRFSVCKMEKGWRAFRDA